MCACVRACVRACARDIGIIEQYKACRPCHFYYQQSCYPCCFPFRRHKSTQINPLKYSLPQLNGTQYTQNV